MQQKVKPEGKQKKRSLPRMEVLCATLQLLRSQGLFPEPDQPNIGRGEGKKKNVIHLPNGDRPLRVLHRGTMDHETRRENNSPATVIVRAGMATWQFSWEIR